MPEHYRIFTGTYDDGSQLLIEQWDTGEVTAATRDHRSDMWSPPITLEEQP